MKSSLRSSRDISNLDTVDRLTLDKTTVKRGTSLHAKAAPRATLTETVSSKEVELYCMTRVGPTMSKPKNAVAEKLSAETNVTIQIGELSCLKAKM